jgi:hypothetical protein
MVEGRRRSWGCFRLILKPFIPLIFLTFDSTYYRCRDPSEKSEKGIRTSINDGASTNEVKVGSES